MIGAFLKDSEAEPNMRTASTVAAQQCGREPDAYEVRCTDGNYEWRRPYHGELEVIMRTGKDRSGKPFEYRALFADAPVSRGATPAVVAGLVGAQTEARASLWVPAKPEHAKLGWTYDFEQTERISRAAYDSTGYEATMEVVEFVMAEADRRHATALAAKDAELAAANDAWRAMKDRAHAAEAQLAEANKALEPFAALADIFDHHGGNRPREGVIAQWSDHRVGDRDITVEHLRAARRAREAQGGKNG